MCEISVFANTDYCILMYMIPCFVNIKPDLQVHPQPWSCICDICMFIYAYVFTHGLAVVIN